MEFNLPLWLIPLLPLAGAAWNGVCGKRYAERAVATIAVGAVALAFGLSLLAVVSLGEGPRIETAGAWIAAAGLEIPFNFYLDPLSGVMTLVVTGVGLLIHIYAAGYMHSEGGYYRFFAYMNLFLFFMLTLVLAGNYLLAFVGWEGVGLCSYLLIGFYFRKDDAADAGKKAFLVTRIGDFGFLLAVLLLYWTFGSLNFSQVLPAAAGFAVETDGTGPLTLICLLLLMGAAGKSAQVPLYVWLPDAMLGPTPVSALIHAATMVTAGVYIIARSGPIYVHAPEAMFVVAVVGGVTALYAATIGVVQNDIKRVLAYSTISQIGYMVMACGVAAYSAAIFHLVTHAFFKALLFLGAGSVIHAMGGEQDIRRMGGLKKSLPRTYWTFLAACLALAALWPFAGFFSKDLILWEAYASPYGSVWLWLLGIVTAGISSFYIFRLFFLTFHGAPKARVGESGNGGHLQEASHPVPEASPHAHESPAIMTWPLIALAVLSVAGGWMGSGVLFDGLFGEEDPWSRFIAPAFALTAIPGVGEAAHSASTEHLFMALSLVVSLAGIGFAYLLYELKPGAADDLEARFRSVHRLVLNKYYVDEVYRKLFVNPLVYTSREVLWKAMDMTAIDGSIARAARGTGRFGDALRGVQSGNVRSYAAWVMLGAMVVIGFLVGWVS